MSGRSNPSRANSSWVTSLTSGRFSTRPRLHQPNPRRTNCHASRAASCWVNCAIAISRRGYWLEASFQSSERDDRQSDDGSSSAINAPQRGADRAGRMACQNQRTAAPDRIRPMRVISPAPKKSPGRSIRGASVAAYQSPPAPHHRKSAPRRSKTGQMSIPMKRIVCRLNQPRRLTSRAARDRRASIYFTEA